MRVYCAVEGTVGKHLVCFDISKLEQLFLS